MFELFIIISNAYETFKFVSDVVFNSTCYIIKCTIKVLASVLVKLKKNRIKTHHQIVIYSIFLVE